MGDIGVVGMLAEMGMDELTSRTDIIEEQLKVISGCRLANTGEHELDTTIQAEQIKCFPQQKF